LCTGGAGVRAALPRGRDSQRGADAAKAEVHD
jgi:hypothetical protein